MQIPTKFKNLKLNGVQLTEDAIIQTQEWYITNCEECIEGAINKDFFCNDIDAYVKSNKEYIDDLNNWNFAVSLAFLQRAYYFQTGLSVPMLP